MIVLDTHVWIWWVGGDQRLTETQSEAITANESGTIGVSAISCWEIAKLVELARLELSVPIEPWFTAALGYPGVNLLELSPAIAIASTRLEGAHRDPADQIILATATTHNCPLVTSDTKLMEYPNVATVS